MPFKRSCIFAILLLLSMTPQNAAFYLLDLHGPGFADSICLYFSLNRNLIMTLSMTACDLCAMYKPWNTQLDLVFVIMEEFWQQV